MQIHGNMGNEGKGSLLVCAFTLLEGAAVSTFSILFQCISYFPIHSIHLRSVFNPCSINSPQMFQPCSMQAPSILHPFNEHSIHVPFMSFSLFSLPPERDPALPSDSARLRASAVEATVVMPTEPWGLSPHR